MASLAEALKTTASKVTEYILSRVSGTPRQLYDAALHLIKAGGKRLRPFIVVTVARGLGAPMESALPFAAGVELIHNFTLIHDDIIDRDEFRRGVPTVHKLWGEPFAIIAGDLLFAKAFEIMGEACERGVSPQRVARAYRVLARATRIVAEGQALDMLFEDLESVSVDDYLDMVYRKTGALFEASAVLGGLVVTDDEETINALAEYGKNLGIAFQIRDDILGLVGDEKTLGKPVYSDIREGKKTILVIYALSRLDEEQREKLLSTLGKRNASREELEEAAKLILDAGALDYAESVMKDYAGRARTALSKIEFVDREAARLLEELIDFVIRRSW